MGKKGLSIYNLIKQEEQRKQKFDNREQNFDNNVWEVIKNKVLIEARNNLVFNFFTMDISDLNNLWMITFLILKNMLRNDSLQWIYFSEDAYNYLNWLDPVNVINKLLNLIKKVDKWLTTIQINYDKQAKEINYKKLYVKKNNYYDKQSKLESLDFEIKLSISYLNAMQDKLEKINDFLTKSYNWLNPFYPFKEINYIKHYIEYIEWNDIFAKNLNNIKIMLSKLENYKIWQELGNLREVVLIWSLDLILILREDIFSKIEDYNEAVKKLFVL